MKKFKLKKSREIQHVVLGLHARLTSKLLMLTVGLKLFVRVIGVNPAGDAGDVSTPIFWLVGTSMGMSPLPTNIRGGSVVEYELLIAIVKRKQR